MISSVHVRPASHGQASLRKLPPRAVLSKLFQFPGDLEGGKASSRLLQIGTEAVEVVYYQNAVALPLFGLY